MNYTADILLHLSGSECNRHVQFPTAYAQQHCHICHVPFRSIHPDCPCLHWLMNSYANVNRLQPVLDRFGLSAAVEYLALCAIAQRGLGKGRVGLGCTYQADHISINLLIGQRRFTFKFDTWESNECELEFGSARSGLWDVVRFELQPHDRTFLERLSSWDACFPLPRAHANTGIQQAHDDGHHPSALSSLAPEAQPGI